MVRFIPTTAATAATLWVLASMIGCGSPSPTHPTDDRGLVEVRLNHRTPVDEPNNHLTLLYREPREELILPEDVDTSDAWFFDVYYTRTGSEDFRGDFLLLNFWGEWCAPCVAEIPDLVAASSRYSSEGLKIISFLESQSPDRADGILAKFGADWPQVLFTDKYKNLFRINAFPTNLLILPDGTTYVRTATVNDEFLNTYIKMKEVPGIEPSPSD